MRMVQTPVIPVVGRLIRDNPGTISLGQGVVGYPPPLEALEAVARFAADPDNHRYGPVEGIPPLLEAIAAKLAADNAIASSDESRIVVTAGGNMAFANAVLAITDPGDEVILLEPYYFNHHMAVTIAGCRPVVVPTDAAYQPVVPRIEAAITSRTRAVVTVSPNNPSGAVYPEATLRAVNALCRERGLYHVHDEAYEYFVYDGARSFSPASAPGTAGHTISLFSLSKSYGFASWRIGYMVIPAHLFDAVCKIQDTILICPPADLAVRRGGGDERREGVLRAAARRDRPSARACARRPRRDRRSLRGTMRRGRVLLPGAGSQPPRSDGAGGAAGAGAPGGCDPGLDVRSDVRVHAARLLRRAHA